MVRLGFLLGLQYFVYPGALVTFATLGCLAFGLLGLTWLTWYSWPNGELFSPLAPLGALRCPWMSSLTVGSVVCGAPGRFSYFGYSWLLNLLVCLS